MKRTICILLAVLALSACHKEGGENNGGQNNNKPKDWTITGTISGDDGALLEGVVVSDGIHCVKTDSKGVYYLPADLSKTDYVFVSTPSTYAAPVQDGQAVFWKFLKDCTKGSDGKYNIPFTLKKISNPERYTVLIFADPQPRKSNAGLDQVGFHSLDCCNDMYRDMKEYAATIKGRQVYGIGLGDIVHQALSLLTNYRNGMATTGISTYNIIGNHDQGHVLEQSDAEASRTFMEQMGPVNYSFNLGGMHYLMLDNMIAPGPGSGKYGDECLTGLTDDIWEFVKNDLSLVPTTTPLMVCAHSPMMRAESGKDRTGTHLADLRGLLAKYPKAYVWAGHTHTSFNYVDKTNPVIETHTVSRVTGALWTNDYLGSNGTPRGYVVFDYDNGDVSWKFKPIYYQTGTYIGEGNKTAPDYTWRDWDYDASGKAIMKSTGAPLDQSYQMQLFPPGTYDPADKYIYANIFLWDEMWSTPRFTCNGNPAMMKRVTETDFKYSYSDWQITAFYQKNTKVGSEFEPDKNNCSSIFRVFVEEEHGSGTVSVKDRFGNTHTSTITW
ncbi:MAG: calcineurin-like phosphoesterase C-terminal domain-containing protein [Bacteroidales bacterium]|nr:calcineurin-like phosphoesterase C-terminal domain-containing protein [Bacteroidales bacterium]